MSHPIEQLEQIMAKLRDPENGCPWDLKQTFDTIVPHTIEETYEVVDAIQNRDWPNLKEELGDLLFQVIFYSQLAKEQELFDFSDVVETVNEKLTRRHPHVFSDVEFESDEEINANWEAEKSKRKSPSRQSGRKYPRLNTKLFTGTFSCYKNSEKNVQNLGLIGIHLARLSIKYEKKLTKSWKRHCKFSPMKRKLSWSSVICYLRLSIWLATLIKTQKSR